MARKRMTAGEIRERIRNAMPGREGEDLVRAFDGLSDDVATLKTWCDDLKTTLDALVAKLNADAGVTGTDYASIAAGPDV